MHAVLLAPLLGSCVIGGENPNGNADWNPLQGTESLGDAAPSAEAEDPAEPSGSSDDGSSSGGGETIGAVEDLSEAMEEIKGNLFINLAADAMYVVTAEIGEMSYSPAEDWEVQYNTVSCEGTSDILITGGCSAMTFRQTYTHSGGSESYEGSSIGLGSFPHVEGGVPVGWTCGQPAIFEGSINGVTYTYTVLSPAEMYAVCLAVE